MVLSDRDLRARMAGDVQLITPFIESQLQAASYDLSLSNRISVCSSTGSVISLNDDAAVEQAFRPTTISEQGYVLQPGQFILVQVNETIHVPVDLCAHIRPRTRFTRLGLLVTPQHCNPGYSGRLSLGLYNAGLNAVRLVPGLKIAQVVYETLTSVPSEEKQYQNKTEAAYHNETDLRGAVFSAAELSPEAKDLYEKLREDLLGDR